MSNAATRIYNRPRRPVLLAVVLFGITACSTPPSGSEEYWFNKLQMEQRAQCSQLPEPLASSCLKNVANRSYQDFVRERSAAKQQPDG